MDRRLPVLALALGLSSVASADEQIWIHTYLSKSEMGVIDATTGDYTEVGNAPTMLFDVAFSPDGELYGLAYEGGWTTLWLLDTEDLADGSSRIGYVGSEKAAYYGNSLVFGEDGTLYAGGWNWSTGNVVLYSIALEANTSKINLATDVVDYTASGTWSAGDLAFASDGLLYHTTASNELIAFDVDAGTYKVVGDIGFSEVYGLAYDVNADVMYGMSAASQELFTIDLDTGAGTLSFASTDLAYVGGAAIIDEAGHLPDIEVTIDIKPGSNPSAFNAGSSGSVPVLIPGSDELDVAEIDLDSLSLFSMGVRTVGKDKVLASYSDENGDGIEDVVVKLDPSTFDCGDGSAVLTGKLSDGTALIGTNSDDDPVKVNGADCDEEAK